MNPFFCLACVRGFGLTYSTVFTSAHEFSHFYPSDSLPHPSRGEAASCSAVFSCRLGLNHENEEGTGSSSLLGRASER